MSYSITKDAYRKICGAETVYTTAVRGSYELMDKDELIDLIDVIGGLLLGARDGITLVEGVSEDASDVHFLDGRRPCKATLRT